VSDQLQTSPYLTCIWAGEASPIVFAIDERTLTVPDVTPNGTAAFGVIGLDRSVVWVADTTVLDALQHAAGTPVSRQSLTERYGDDVVMDLVGRGWLQRPDELCAEYLLTTAQIEVTAHCNWNCTFCPVSVDRKPSATMSMPLFEEIIEKISPFDTIRYVTFHFYNEPLLDRFFDERIAVLKKHGLLLRLFTKASQLTAEKIATLKQAEILYGVVVNLPSLHEESFRALTQVKTHSRTIRNVNAAIESGLPVEIVVNGTGDDLMRRVGELRKRYETLGVQVNSTLMSDRAGTVAERYGQEVHIEGPLRGCAWPVNHAHFSVNGDMFICCNDYYQREIFGNIRLGSVHEIMTSKAAILVRQRVFGVADAPSDYVCRSCHDQLMDFPRRQFRPLASFPLGNDSRARAMPRA
jgi:MoaA/NifB/PqqE/SkfB family radical SAM enzyme